MRRGIWEGRGGKNVISVTLCYFVFILCFPLAERLLETTCAAVDGTLCTDLVASKGGHSFKTPLLMLIT